MTPQTNAKNLYSNLILISQYHLLNLLLYFLLILKKVLNYHNLFGQIEQYQIFLDWNIVYNLVDFPLQGHHGLLISFYHLDFQIFPNR